MKQMPYTKEALRLMQEGALALAVVEATGIPIDTEYLKGARKKAVRKIEHLKRGLDCSDVMKVWKKTFGKRANINSGDQLGKVLFDVMGIKPPMLTASGKYKTDEPSLKTVDHPFIKQLLRLRKLQKAYGTYLKGISREVVDGRIHPVFNLHLAKTYRSSSNDPNFQNIPIRDPEMGSLIRRAFVAETGHHLVEVDYSGIEIRVAACYHKDPAMIRYIEDPTTDLHRDMAMECYMLSRKEVTKRIRYCGKNMFVFPQFYGDWYIDCARSLWGAIEKMSLETALGVPLLVHLQEQGITRLGDLDPRERPPPGTFEAHIKSVEKRFWDKRFPVYKQWKLDWFSAYEEQGWFSTYTGFICQGFMKRNEVINYPVQGPAFHCLLWALIQLVKELPRRKMRSRVVGQIHDSILAHVPTEERDDFYGLAQEIMVDALMRHWPWIIVPMGIEIEVSPEGGSWVDKQEIDTPTKRREVPYKKLTPDGRGWRRYWEAHPEDQERMLRWKRWLKSRGEKEVA